MREGETTMMRSKAFRAVFAFTALALLASCAGVQYRYPTDTEIAALLAKPAPSYPATRFAVASDPHLYDLALGAAGAAFQQNMIDERKLLSAGPELLAEALDRTAKSGARFLLISGDLTKDGERESHLLMARQLGELARGGIRVFVVPGNHDVLNPKSVSFSEKDTAPVANITPADFAEIYKECGYGDALFRDPGSLSYVAEPVPGLWLVAIDSCNYDSNKGKSESVTGGGLTQARIAWIEGMLGEALRRDKAVIVMLHHGVVEHYPGNDQYYPDYLVNGWQQFSDMLATYRARVVFTGHFHAQDITLKKNKDGRFLFDVETGSLPTWPDPMRIVEIGADQRMTISSSLIKELPSYAARGIDFGSYSEDFIREAGDAIAVKTMKGLGVPQRDTTGLAPQVTEALVAHFRGDEQFTGTLMLGAPGLSLMGNLVVALRKDQVAGLWHDLEPADNNLSIDLATGAWSPGS
jgi:3',5'-cyclic AMP phosphodiesterase CpdA